MKHHLNSKQHLHSIRSSLIVAGVALLVSSLANYTMAQDQQSDSQERQSGRGGRGGGSFDASEYVKRLDRNGNGVLEEDEVSGRTKRYIESLGMDASQPMKVNDVLAKINNKVEAAKNTTATPSSGQTLVRKVPGFGVEKTASSQLPNFTSSAASGGNLSQFSDDIKEEVESILRRYDKNQSRALEADEIKAARWGQPAPEASDLNHDGILTVDELATRYAQRARATNEAETANSQNSQRSSRSGRSPNESNDSSNTESRNRDFGGSSSSEARSSSGSSFATDPSRYRKYAEGILDKNDTDKDGKLSKDEYKNIKRAPEKVDSDGDGFVTIGELTDGYERDANGGTSSSKAESSDSGDKSTSSSSSRGDSRSRRSGSSGSSGGSNSDGAFSFNSNDANGDGQVQMYEYTSEWTDEKLKEFRALDKNGDGVITSEEYRSK